MIFVPWSVAERNGHNYEKKCIIIALIFIVLLTPVISVPSLIYLKDTEDKYAKIYNVKQVDKLSLLTAGNNDYPFSWLFWR